MSGSWADDIAAAQGEEELWDPDRVREQLALTMRHVSHAVARVGPRGYGSGMPAYVHEVVEDEGGEQLTAAQRDELLADIAAAAESAERRRPLSAAEVSLVEASLGWFGEYLAHLPGPRRVLRTWLRCKASRRPFGKACKDRGWSKATADRAVTKALSAIAQGLNRAGVRPPK